MWPARAQEEGDVAAAIATALTARGDVERSGADLRQELRGHVARNEALYAGRVNAQAADLPQDVALEAAQRHLNVRIRTAYVASAAEVAAAAAAPQPGGDAENDSGDEDDEDKDDDAETAADRCRGRQHLAKHGWRVVDGPAPEEETTATVWLVSVAGACHALATTAAGKTRAATAQRDVPGSLACPVPNCGGHELASYDTWVRHYNGVHLARGDARALDVFLGRSGRHLCPGCAKHTTAQRAAPHAGCGGDAGRARKRGRQQRRGGPAERTEAAREREEQARAALTMPTLEQAVELRLPTLQSVPAKFREAYAVERRRQLEAIDTAGKSGTYEPHWRNHGEGPPADREEAQRRAWRDYFLFTRAVLRTHPLRRGGRRRRPVLDESLAARLREWTSGDWRKLWAGTLKAATGAQRLAVRTSAHDAAERRRRARKKVSQRQLSAAMRALTATGLHPDPVPAARAKYPPPNAEAPRATMPPPEDLQHDEEAHGAGVAAWTEARCPPVQLEHFVHLALDKARHRKAGTAPGHTGERFEHMWTPLLLDEEEDATLRDGYVAALAAVVRAVAAGDVPGALRDLFAGGDFTGLLKPDGGCRPIIVTEVFGRLVGNVTLSRARAEHGQQLEDMVGNAQMGAGRQGGADALAHAAQYLFDLAWERNTGAEAYRTPDADEGDVAVHDPWGLLLLDGENAFGELDRQTFFDIIAAKCPLLYPFVRLCYGGRNKIRVRDVIVEATRGVLQGDSLAPFLHAIVLRVVWGEVAAGLPRDIEHQVDMWFADDGTVFGRVSTLRRLYYGLKQVGPARGILVRDDKLQLVIPGVQDAADAGEWCSQLGGRVGSDGAKIMGVPIGEETFVRSYTDQKIRQLKEEYAAIAELQNPAMEIQLVRAVMAYKVNHVLRARTRTVLADLIRRHDDLQLKALMSTLCLADDTAWSEASRLIRRLPQRAGGLGIPSAADIADAAFTGATLLIPELLSRLLGPAVEVPVAAEVRDYLGRWDAECSSNSLRTPSIGEHPRQASRHRQQLLSTGKSRRLERRMGEIAAADRRLGAHWSSVRADRVGCAGFVGDIGSWQEDRYHNSHYPDDDVGRAYRVGLARYLCLPLCEAASLCRGCGEAALDPYGDHALVCSKGRGGLMGAWKKARHDGARNILVRLGKAAGLREGADMDVEVPYLFTRYRPSDIRVRIRPGGQDMHFEDSGANGFELPGAAPSADTAFKDVAYDVTIAATQTFNNGQYGHSIATRGPGTEAKAAIESKIAGYRAALADVQPLTNRRTKFVVLAFESSGWTDSTVQRLVNTWEQQASRRLGPDRRWSPAGSSTRHELSSEIQYWNSVSLILRLGEALWVSKSPYLDDGWPSFGR